MTRLSRRLARLAAAAVLAAAAGTFVLTSPASAATCSTDHGVSVVVDFHELGGGVQSGCVVSGAGQTAADLVPEAGFSLDYVQSQPGFVCRVQGQPADDPCVRTPPSDAYWGLWWSDGRSGSWTYATTGASGLHVPEGGYVAFSWNGSSARSTPGTTPMPHPTAPSTSATPTAHPTHSHPTTSPSHQTSGPTATPTVTPTVTSSASTTPSQTPTVGASTTPGKHRTGTPTPGATPEVGGPGPSPSTGAVPAASDPADPDDGGLPAWVAPVVIVLLFGAVGTVAVVRRRRGTPTP